ncbi:dihydroneopterin aldolase [Parendozoicomonas haliclonae]|uniref:7,8-dihydroneopterin aldolase n=1 Tax=Parendozoicomonas haliclonae TaxID=1960125 RepID=A0A1X7AG00_9GAMM|nr:dihydroneopterin aldolase [Parendozoicomonas haliclonae]SMA31720.1 Dihydroneopterin aldolase [Parendozoicomonas haliclonae]
MDKVLINDLYVETVIGFYHWEHEEPQPLIIDLELGTDFSDAFVSDDLGDAMNYAEIRRQVKELCQESRFHLLERLAGAIVMHLFSEFPVNDVRLKIRKPHALRDAVAGIETYRTREQMGISLP